MRVMSLLVLKEIKKEREKGNREKGRDRGNIFWLYVPSSSLDLVAFFIVLCVEGIGINCTKICNTFVKVYSSKR